MTRRTTPIIYGLVVALLFATHAVISRMLLEAIDPLAFAALRAVGAGLVLTLVHARAIARLVTPRLLAKTATVAAFGFGLNQVLLVEGLIRAGTADASLINGAIPLAATTAAVVFKLEPLGRARLTGVLLGFAAMTGFTLIVQRSGLRGHLAGDALLVGNVVALAVALALLRLLTRTVPSGVVAALMLLFGGLFLLPFAAPTLPETLAVAFSTPAMALLTCFETLVCTALAWLLYVKAIAALGVVQASTFGYLQAPMAALMTWIALAEAPPLLLAPLTIALGLAVWLVVRSTPSVRRA
jgi:drug/metabolite transporter (DMT)-like permease